MLAEKYIPTARASIYAHSRTINTRLGEYKRHRRLGQTQCRRSTDRNAYGPVSYTHLDVYKRQD